MRVLAGTKRGLDLRCGHGERFRATQQLVKGSIFDTIGREVEGSTFLDLFAGSGGVGIEALSRGAKHVIFVEQDRKMLRSIRTNLERCGFGKEQATVKIADAIMFFEKAARSRAFFEIVFADPPYACDAAQRIVDIAASAEEPLCNMLIVEHGRPISIGPAAALELLRTRKFGQTRVSYFRYRKEGGTNEESEGSLPRNVRSNNQRSC